MITSYSPPGDVRPRTTLPWQQQPAEQAGMANPPSPPINSPVSNVTLPTFGNLNWQAIRLNTGDTGFTAFDSSIGKWLYYGPDQKLYANSYSGEVHAGDLNDYLGQSVSQFFSPTTPSPNPGNNSGGGGTGGSQNPSTNPNSPSNIVGQLVSGADSYGVPGAGNIASEIPVTSAGTTTTTTGGANTVALIAIVAAIGLLVFYFYKKHKSAKTEPQPQA